MQNSRKFTHQKFRGPRALSVMMLALALTSCAGGGDQPDGESEKAARPEDSSGAQMVACLKSGGAQARLSEHEGMVLVQTDLGVSVDVSGDSSVTIASSGDSEGDVGVPIFVGDFDEASGLVWAAFRSSADLDSDRELQDIYADCEAKFPDFKQPEFNPESDPEFKAQMAKAQKDALEFAKCARAEGFDWVEDPGSALSGDSPMGVIFVPEEVTNEELRGAVNACYQEDYAFGWAASSPDVGLQEALGSVGAPGSPESNPGERGNAEEGQ